jgi:Ca2+-binding EF-hand superfamily protein
MKIFCSFDQDDSGTIDKLEMMTFIKELFRQKEEDSIGQHVDPAQQTINPDESVNAMMNKV